MNRYVKSMQLIESNLFSVVLILFFVLIFEMWKVAMCSIESFLILKSLSL